MQVCGSKKHVAHLLTSLVQHMLHTTRERLSAGVCEDGCREGMDAGEIISWFADMRACHASQLVEPVQFDASERRTLDQLCALEPEAFAAQFRRDHCPLLSKLCGISSDGQMGLFN